MQTERLFWKLWECKNEAQVDALLNTTPELQNPCNWKSLGQLPGNVGVVENQQANSAAALVEKSSIR